MTKHADSRAAKIRAYLRLNPTATPKEVAEKLGVTNQTVSVIKYQMSRAGEKVQPAKGTGRAVSKLGWKTIHVSTTDKPIVNPQIEAVGKAPPVMLTRPKSDPVNHPAHYKVGGIETIDFIEAKRLNYNLGNAVKYITRADHKGNRKQDLEKAIWYLKRELDHSL